MRSEPPSVAAPRSLARTFGTGWTRSFLGGLSTSSRILSTCCGRANSSAQRATLCIHDGTLVLSVEQPPAGLRTMGLARSYRAGVRAQRVGWRTPQRILLEFLKSPVEEGRVGPGKKEASLRAACST